MQVEWAMRQGLGGVTAWAIDLDDFSNRCCAEPSPLLRAAARALGRSTPPPPTRPCERPPEPVTPAPPTTTPAESDGKFKFLYKIIKLESHPREICMKCIKGHALT